MKTHSRNSPCPTGKTPLTLLSVTQNDFEDSCGCFEPFLVARHRGKVVRDGPLTAKISSLKKLQMLKTEKQNRKVEYCFIPRPQLLKELSDSNLTLTHFQFWVRPSLHRDFSPHRLHIFTDPCKRESPRSLRSSSLGRGLYTSRGVELGRRFVRLSVGGAGYYHFRTFYFFL